MRRLYISGPFRATGTEAVYGPFTPSIVRRNEDTARRYAELAWTCGWAVLCPHLNTAQMDGIPHLTSDTFISGDLAWLDIMLPNHDAILLLPDWVHSEGAKIEAQHAARLNLIRIDTREFSFAKVSTILARLAQEQEGACDVGTG